MKFTRSLSLDYETYSPEDLPKTGMYKYMEHPEFEVMLMAWKFSNEKEAFIWDLTDKKHLPPHKQIPAHVLKALTDPTVEKKAFNAPFEMNGSERHFGIEIDPAQWKCTMIEAAMCGLPFKLDIVSRVLGVAQKNPDGMALINYFCKPCKPTIANGMRTRNLPHHDREKWERFKRYCKQDVISELAVADKVSFLEVPDTEWKLWQLDYKINSQGIKVDQKLIKNALKMNEDYRARLTEELLEISGVTKPNSVKQIINWLNVEEDLEKEQSITSLKKDVIPLVLRKLTTAKSKRVLAIRQEMSKTSVKKYSAMLKCVCKDGRIRGLFQFYGANRTGRFAGRLVQMQNLPKSNLRDSLLNAARQMVLDLDAQFMELIFGPIPDMLSKLIRTAFVAEEGHEFIVSDYSAIEARVISWLATEQWRLDLFKNNGKIYEAMGAKMFKVPIEDCKKGTKLYDASKVGELACGYNGGIDAIVRMALTYKIDIPDDQLEPIKNNWREVNPNIVNLWKGCKAAAELCIKTGSRVRLTDVRHYDGTYYVKVDRGVCFEFVNGNLLVTMPSGRKLCYWGAHLVDGKYGKEIVYWGLNQETKKWERQRTYGGKLVENFCQAIARDCLGNGMLNLDEAGIDIPAHVHDESVNEVLKGRFTQADINRLMINPAPWMKDLPMNAEGFVNTYYKKES